MLDRVGQWATLCLPLFLTHWRGVAEGLIDGLAVVFLLRSAMLGDWWWSRSPWFAASVLWWVWTVLCSLPFAGMGTGGESFLQAVMLVRFPVMVAALSCWTLRDARMRRWMAVIVSGCAVYIALQIVFQAVAGFNMFGDVPPPDGTLTGPYREPRAAAPLSRLLPPVAFLACALIRARVHRAAPRWMATAAVLLAGCGVMVLAGQRMPLLLTGMGLLAGALILRELRGPALGVLACVPLLVGALSVARPAAFFHLVMKFRAQMSDFAASHYGLIYDRVLVMAGANPLTGLGFDAFRYFCADPRFFAPGPFGTRPDGGGAGICVQHAHNHYLQALSDSGVPGLILFAAMVAAWLTTLARGLGDGRQAATTRAWRVGLFVAVLIQEWPLASSSAFTNMPLGGWAFMLLGLGLGEYNAYMAAQAEQTEGREHVRDHR
ncbi:hypothetical protein AA103196_1667 [Ameyamaea chiangmaiensis NBRC 103196]|uniref:O-antigen ligase family protein n=1 Tax=Ameyamaea chiangmaiensis TaxID=442969 RepID=UPI001BAF672D|nr:O-antigen ligase family protein [Ameyamaea chiangmaiensis]MBS4074067.1 O-antigen ligase family protein [Ameyamaea chiangmaiensis]GBQ67371.1 hypothetical protein AA103196_1667 [Ameyamaea chiangmaiensis NBRC 103196]